MAAQFLADVDEGLREIVDFIRIENPASALIRELLEHLVAAFDVNLVRLVALERQPVGIGADAIDDGFGANGGVDRFAQGVVAEVVVAVADDYQDATEFGIGAFGNRGVDHFGGGEKNGVVEGGASAGALLADGVGQLRQVSGVILNHFRFVIEGHDEGLVLVTAQDVLEKVEGRIFFEIEAGADAVGGIEQDADTQRKVGFAAEIANLLRIAVFEDFEIGLIEIGDKIAVAVHDRGDEVNEAGGGSDGRSFLLR